MLPLCRLLLLRAMRQRYAPAALAADACHAAALFRYAFAMSFFAKRHSLMLPPPPSLISAAYAAAVYIFAVFIMLACCCRRYTAYDCLLLICCLPLLRHTPHGAYARAH